MTKICKECGETKPLSKFNKNSKTKDGYLKTCSACLSLIKRPNWSLRKAIDEKCKDCIYDPFSGEGNWREQVESCTSGNCPLYEMRPVSSKGKG